MSNLGDETLTMNQVAEYFRVGRMTITAWVKSKLDFPKPYKVGRKNLWKKSDIEAYLESCKVKK